MEGKSEHQEPPERRSTVDWSLIDGKEYRDETQQIATRAISASDADYVLNKEHIETRV